MRKNQIFKKLLDEGLHSVATRQNQSLRAIELKLAEKTGYSRATVQHWRRGNIPPETETLEAITRYCVQYGRFDRVWVEGFLRQGNHPRIALLVAELFPDEGVVEVSQKQRIFLCYARQQEPDQTLAIALAQALSQTHHVFFDQASSLQNWAQTIEQECQQADVFLSLLSEEASHNEVVLAQIRLAWERWQQQGQPRMISIQLNELPALHQPLQSYVQEQVWLRWQDAQQTEGLLGQLQQLLQNGRLPDTSSQYQAQVKVESETAVPTPSPSAKRLEQPEGTMDVESRFYIEREGDVVALQTIAQDGVTLTIKAPRQMGKSSLLVRVAEQAKKQGKQVIFLDFQLFQASLHDSEIFFRQLCSLLCYQLGIEDKSDKYWRIPLTNTFRCTQFVHKEILQKQTQPILLAMDEVDSLFETEMRTDFFGMLRSWHNNRARSTDWKKLDLALVTSTEPYYFVQNLSQSPFNVGEMITLPSFTMAQVAELNRLHQTPLTPKQSADLFTLVNGHPYLVRRALYLVATGRVDAMALFVHPSATDGPFGDHLRSLLLRLHHNPALLNELQAVLQTGQCSDDIFFRLRGAGLVQRDANGRCLPSSPLYAQFFERQLTESGG